jgi:hypothetical protein
MNTFFWWVGLPLRLAGGLAVGVFLLPFVMLMPENASTGYGNIWQFVLGR